MVLGLATLLEKEDPMLLSDGDACGVAFERSALEKQLVVKYQNPLVHVFTYSMFVTLLCEIWMCE